MVLQVSVSLIGNVIWSDTSKAARAMLDLSAAPKSKEIKKEDIKKPSSNKESTEEKSSPKGWFYFPQISECFGRGSVWSGSG